MKHIVKIAAILGCSSLFAGTVFTTPTGLAPGTQYQLVFITADTTPATSTDIADYNTFVTNEAALNATLAAFDTANGITWTVIGSTTTVNANANAPSTGLVFTLNNVQVAATGLYGGSLLSPIDITQNGDVLGNDTWTGSTTAGTAEGGINDLGQTFPNDGHAGAIDASWISNPADAIQLGNGLSLYALSNELTVPQPSSTPEPATVVLTGAALVLIAIKRLS